MRYPIVDIEASPDGEKAIRKAVEGIRPSGRVAKQLEDVLEGRTEVG